MNSDLLSIAREVATTAAELVARRRSEGVAVADRKSSSVDIVTHADRESEALIREMLAKLRPGDGFYGEEGSADAAGTDSYEQNRNLILGDGPRADSIPNLEIETGDIEGAGHASATGRFDDEQLFYLQARGIPEEEARRLVVIGFLAEIVQQIGSADLEQHLQLRLEAELEATR